MSAGDRLQILYTGPVFGLCRHRAEALRELGHEVTLIVAEVPRNYWRMQLYRVGNRLNRPPDVLGTNRAILNSASRQPVDLLWVDKGRSIRPRTLERMRREHPGTFLINYSPDDNMNPDNQSVNYLATIPLYDLHVTTKSYNVAELREHGARDVLFVDNGYDPATHHPIELTEAERRAYAADVGFIGGFEPERAQTMTWLADRGVGVEIWGYQWERMKFPSSGLEIRNERLWKTEYAKAVCATKINLGFLRKVNRDLQTTRSVEIPACGAFMLAERTDEHRRLFEEGKEAEYFSGRDELLAKCRYYLEHDEARRRIARAGYERCIREGYSNAGRLGRVIEYVRPLVVRTS